MNKIQINITKKIVFFVQCIFFLIILHNYNLWGSSNDYLAPNSLIKYPLPLQHQKKTNKPFKGKKNYKTAFKHVKQQLDILLLSPNQQTINLILLRQLKQHLQKISTPSYRQNSKTDFLKMLSSEYDKILYLLSIIIHSDSWLSPTSFLGYSASQEKGILQGGKYTGSYERDYLNPLILQSKLKDFFNTDQAWLFRNSNAAIDSLVGAINITNLSLGRNNIILYSNNINQSEKSNLDLFSSSTNKSPQAAVKVESFNKQNNTLIEMIAQKIDSYSSIDLIIDEKDIQNNPEEFFMQIQMIPCVKNIIILTNKPEKFQNYYYLYFYPENKQLFLLYKMKNHLNKNGINCKLSTPVTSLLYFGEDNNANYLIDNLTNLRSLHGNIDNLSRWILLMFIDKIPEDELNQEQLPVYFDQVEKSYFQKNILKMKQKYQQLLTNLEKTSINLNKTDIIMNNFIKTLIQEIYIYLQILNINLTNQKQPLKIKQIFTEYRTFFKYYIFITYFHHQNQNFHSNPKEIYQRISKKLNKIQCKKDPLDNNLFSKTIICSSGMGASSSIIKFLTIEKTSSAKKILCGNNIYYEITSNHYLQSKLLVLKKIDENNMEDIEILLKNNEYGAILIDPISNQFTSKLGSIKNLPVSDINRLVKVLCATTYNQPFYCILDTSLFGNNFQLTEILKETKIKKIPDNLNFIIFSSLQKLHQEGQEISSGGVLSIINSNLKELTRIYNKLTETRDAIGAKPYPYQLKCLEYGIPDALSIRNRTKRLFETNQKLAKGIYAKFQQYQNNHLLSNGCLVVHPSLKNHPDRKTLNNQTNINVPYFGVSFIDRVTNLNFINELNDLMIKHNFPGLQCRDSYGFSKPTFSFFSNATFIRICFPDMQEKDIEKIINLFEKALVNLLYKLKYPKQIKTIKSAS